MQSQMINPSQMLSDTLVWMKYAQHLTDRRETWTEVVGRSQDMHLDRFSFVRSPRLAKEIVRGFDMVRDKQILSSMRSLQFAGAAIAKHESRINNCTYAPISDMQTISECFFNLLCGTGVGYSVERENIRQLPAILPYSKIRKAGVHVVKDTLEGWCDAVLVLLRSYTEDGIIPVMDYSAIREKGTPLKTTGGYAPGYEPLKKALDHVERILLLAMGRRLRSLEVHDIMCHLADAVASGGIRRAAMICFFDNDDEDMLSCKAGDWWKENPQRGRANNSAVFFIEETTQDQFFHFMHRVEKNNTGEPGVFWTRSRTQRSNPCCEATLDPHSFCNLTEINMATVKSRQGFLERCHYASLIGTLQAHYTNFSYLRPRWREATENSSLIGVSLTGLASVLNSDLWSDALLREGATVVKNTNAFIAGVIGINPAHRATLIKPSGTASLVLGCASGMHVYHAQRYLRGITVGKSEPIYPILMDAMPDNIQDLYGDPSKVFCYFPLQAPQGAWTRHDETALSLLHRVKKINNHWIQPGHRTGENTHNASVTVSVRPDEWNGVTHWMWDNREHYAGIALMPYWGGTHPQLPLQEVDEDTWNRHLNNIKKPIDLSDVKEEWRTSQMEETVACAGGACEIH